MLTILFNCILWHSIAVPIGLGHVQLESYINDPLKAKIEILDASRTDVGQLSAHIATKEEYQKLNIDRDPYLSKVKLSIHKQTGKTYILADSNMPVINPVLNLFISLASPEGQLKRNYTLFFDPPDYADLGVKQPLAPSSKDQHMMPQANEHGRKKMVEKSSNSSAESLSSPKSSLASKKLNTVSKQAWQEQAYGPTQNGQTLWSIANQLGKNTSGTTTQIVWALYETNPDAFAYNNINGLKAGSFLKIPNQQMILKQDPVKIRAAMQIQKKTWQAKISASAKHFSHPTAEKRNQKNQNPKTSVNLSSPRNKKPENNKSPASDSQLDAKIVLMNQLESKEAEIKQLKASLASSVEALNNEKNKNKLLKQQIESLKQEMAILEKEAKETNDKIAELEQEELSSKANTSATQSLEADALSTELPKNKVEAIPLPEKNNSISDQQVKNSFEMTPTTVLNSSDKLQIPDAISNFSTQKVIGASILLVGLLTIFLWLRKRRKNKNTMIDSHADNFENDTQSDNHDYTIDDLLEDDEFTSAEGISSASIRTSRVNNVNPSKDANEDSQQTGLNSNHTFKKDDFNETHSNDNHANEDEKSNQMNDQDDNSIDYEIPALNITSDTDTDFDYTEEDEEDIAQEKSSATKLDLARVYIEMGDQAEAIELLKAVLADGDDAQKEEAQQMLDEISS